MTIRIANAEDIDLLMTMAQKFLETSGYERYSNPEAVKALIESFIGKENEGKLILISDDVGMLAGVVSPFMFGTKLMATEVAWWVDPEARGNGVGKDLLEAFEFYAKKTGCSLVTMVSLDEEIGKYYESKGYKLYERAYVKEI